MHTLLHVHINTYSHTHPRFDSYFQEQLALHNAINEELRQPPSPFDSDDDVDGVSVRVYVCVCASTCMQVCLCICLCAPTDMHMPWC